MAQTMEQEIVKQEESLANAKRALDLDAIDRIYADDLLLTGVMGEPTCDKAAIIGEIKRGREERERSLASGQSIEMAAENEDMKVVTHGDTAVANYRFVVTVNGPNIKRIIATASRTSGSNGTAAGRSSPRTQHSS